MTQAELPFLWFIDISTSTNRSVETMKITAEDSRKAAMTAIFNLHLEDGETIHTIHVSRPIKLTIDESNGDDDGNL